MTLRDAVAHINPNDGGGDTDGDDTPTFPHYSLVVFNLLMTRALSPYRRAS